MKRIISSLLIILILCSQGSSVFASEITNGNDVVVKYNITYKGEYRADVTGGKATAGGVTVTNAPGNAVTLVIVPMSGNAFSWVDGCIDGEAVAAYDIFFLDSEGNRIDANGAGVSISVSGSNLIVYSVNTSGKDKTLNSNTANGVVSFATNGSPYYVIAKKTSGGGTPGDEPTTEPTVEPTAEPTTEPFAPMPEIEEPILDEPTLGDVVILPETEPVDDILHDDYLGTGDGLGQLHIVFDSDYEPEDYELLDVFIDDELQGNSVLVCAFPDEEGNVARRSLILSVDQMVKLTQKQETEHVIFENGSAIVEMDMVDLLGGDMQKLMALILSGEEEITTETVERDWSLVEPVVIPAAQLAKIDVETRTVPVELEDGTICYEVSVWLRWDDHELEVSDMIPSLTVAIAVDDLVTEENFDIFTTLYTIAYQAPGAEEHPEVVPEIVQLPSTLLLMPDELPEHQDDTAEHFLVTIPDEEGELPVTAYDANAHLVPYRHYVLAVDYAGEGIYWVQDVK